MKKIAILATIIVAVISVTSSTGAARERKRMVTDTLATDSLHKEYLENLDKMLNLWYVQQSVDTVEVMDQLDLDSVGIRADYPDSVYIERLSGMNTLINLPFNSVVRNYITTYTQRKRAQVEVMLGLADYYFPLFEEILDLYQLPLELKILPVIESALNPRAVSRVGATGLWQFMYSTGKRYNLQIDSYVDQRRDPLAATHAAARYLRDLYGLYGDWTLVIAAYNCGPGNVNKAIRRAGGKRSYWDIYYYLPRETRGYVPAFIAANYAMRFADQHGIRPRNMEMPKTTDTVVVQGKMHLEQVARVLGLPLQQLRDLNPQYKHDMLTMDSGNPLRLPAERVGEFIDRQDEIRTFKDSIYLNPKRIQEIAKISGDPFYIPRIAGKGNVVKYRVRQGDVLGSIASRYHVTVQQLRAWNGISGSKIRIGQTLLIYTGKNS
ncbi:MAG: transglycosylase SLT domain-containing protein [Bacteroides sp.]|jgi:Soluble lytic murein transglycosylase and related regulatory proteins (some contain LysM/invasin domains)